MGNTTKPIYLDHNATTPLDPQVFEAMKPYFLEEFGNASSSSHVYGWNAKKAVQEARQQLADCLGCQPDEIIWTSGATESNNLAILGVLQNCLKSEPHIITTAVEHKAVLEACMLATKFGTEVTVLDVNEYGQVSVEDIKKAVRPNTKMISIIHANNEIGSLNPVLEIAEFAHNQNILFHTDATQSFGKVDIDLKNTKIDMLSLSAHKIYGPKGVGALYVRKNNPALQMCCVMAGGSQESGLRPGTLNVPGIVGLGIAAQLAYKNREIENQKYQNYYDKIVKSVTSFPDVFLNGHPTQRILNNLSFSFASIDPEDFSLALSGLAVSSGSACTSASSTVSHVLKAIGVPDQQAKATIRLGLGRFTTDQHIEIAIHKFTEMLKKYNNNQQSLSH